MKNPTVLTRTQITRPGRPGKAPFPADLERQLENGEPPASGLSRAECQDMLKRLRRKIERKTCSAPWFDHCWEEGGSYPPKADTTPMRPCHCPRCRRIGKLWPFHYVSIQRFGGKFGFVSFECHLESLSNGEAALLPSSPSGIAARAARLAHINVPHQRTHTKRDSRFSGSPKKKRSAQTVTPKKRI